MDTFLGLSEREQRDLKRILHKYGYPPDKQERISQTLLEQVAGLPAEWAVA